METSSYLKSFTEKPIRNCTEKRDFAINLRDLGEWGGMEGMGELDKVNCKMVPLRWLGVRNSDC